MKYIYLSIGILIVVGLIFAMKPDDCAVLEQDRENALKGIHTYRVGDYKCN